MKEVSKQGSAYKNFTSGLCKSFEASMPVIYKILDALTNKDEEIKEVNRQAEHLHEFKIL